MSTFAFADLLPQGESTALVEESARAIALSNILSMDIRRAQRLLCNRGFNTLYTRSGMTLPDSPHARRNLIKSFGFVALVDSKGLVSTLTMSNLTEARREQSVKISKKVKDLEIRERETRRKDRETEILFSESQTKPCPKRQGRANSHADIGQYNTSQYPRKRLEECVISSEIKFKVIHIHY